MRDNGISRAGISCLRYREQRAFCRQYDEKRKRAAQLLTATAHVERGRHRRDSLENCALAAQQRERLLGDCRIIERTAMEADPAGSDAILRNAAQGVRFEEVGFYGARSAFFRARERFFIELDRELRRRDTHAS